MTTHKTCVTLVYFDTESSDSEQLILCLEQSLVTLFQLTILAAGKQLSQSDKDNKENLNPTH